MTIHINVRPSSINSKRVFVTIFTSKIDEDAGSPVVSILAAAHLPKNRQVIREFISRSSYHYTMADLYALSEDSGGANLAPIH